MNKYDIAGILQTASKKAINTTNDETLKKVIEDVIRELKQCKVEVEE